MIAATLLAAASPVAVPAAEVPIVVIARKLKDWRGGWRTRKGVYECRTTRSTGDAAIDALGCAAIDACVKPQVAAFQAIADSKVPKADRNRRMSDLATSLTPCMEQHRVAGIAALADARAAAQ